MKKVIFFTMIFIFGEIQFSFGQIFEENFDYTAGSLLYDNGWTEFNTSGTSIVIESENLTYPGYPSNSGKSVLVDDDGVDYFRLIGDTLTTGSLYVSLLATVTNATTASGGDYFFSFASLGEATYCGRLYLQKNSDSTFAFGITKASGTPTYTNYIYSFNTTYLIVIKYIFVDGSKNDQAELFVIDGSIPSDDSSPTISITSETSNDPSDIAEVILRQAKTTNVVYVDGIRVSNSWANSALPVELINFNYELINNSVKLKWETATEINNYGFEVERTVETLHAASLHWEEIGFVKGFGNSSSLQTYSFIDRPAEGSKFLYRLKQIDFNGNYKLSRIISVIINTKGNFRLEQNYPNPFNPITNIKYTIPIKCFVRISLFDVLGRKIKLLVNAELSPGHYTLILDGSGLNSGIYFYSLQTKYFTKSKKIILLK